MKTVLLMKDAITHSVKGFVRYLDLVDKMLDAKELVIVHIVLVCLVLQEIHKLNVAQVSTYIIQEGHTGPKNLDFLKYKKKNS